MYDYKNDLANNVQLDIDNGWTVTDPDAEQRALAIDKEKGVWVIRQTNPTDPQTFLEDEIHTQDIEEVTINELLQSFGYKQDVREDENFPLLLAEMHFEMFSL